MLGWACESREGVGRVCLTGGGLLEGQLVFRVVAVRRVRGFLNTLDLRGGRQNGGLLKLSPSPQGRRG